MTAHRQFEDLEPVLALEERAVPDPAPTLTRLRSLTSARIGLRRAGNSLSTSEVLEFQLSHARARDAVHASLQPSSLLNSLLELRSHPGCTLLHKSPSPLLLHSAAPDRQTYLQRPDLGRKLASASLDKLAETAPYESSSLAIVLCDGLSALALERHAVPLLAELLPALSRSVPELGLASVSIVEQARVAIGDQIAQALHASLALVLIGERPGLSSPDSLGAYLTWNPQHGQTTDAERNCVSNIRPEGLSYSQAAARLGYLIQQACQRKLTGVALKDEEDTPKSLPEAANQQS